MSERTVSRRDFRTLGLAARAAASLGGAALGAEGGDRIRCGFIGVGGRGARLLEETLALGNVAVLAICDIDPPRLGNAIGTVEKAPGRAPRGYGGDGDKYAYRRLLASSGEVVADTRANARYVRSGLPDYAYSPKNLIPSASAPLRVNSARNPPLRTTIQPS